MRTRALWGLSTWTCIPGAAHIIAIFRPYTHPLALCTEEKAQGHFMSRVTL